MWCARCSLGGYYDAITRAWYCVSCGRRLAERAALPEPAPAAEVAGDALVAFTAQQRKRIAFLRYLVEIGVVSEETGRAIH